jgi:hypothetical protein
VTVRFLEIAEIELDQAINWYGAQAPGLGNAFLIEVLSAADRIARWMSRLVMPGWMRHGEQIFDDIQGWARTFRSSSCVR